jgi:hypothetical protein
MRISITNLADKSKRRQAPLAEAACFYLKSFGRRSVRLHFSHSATFFCRPFSNSVFMTTSPPHEHRNLCVVTVVRAFLLAAILNLHTGFYLCIYTTKKLRICQVYSCYLSENRVVLLHDLCAECHGSSSRVFTDGLFSKEPAGTAWD